MKEDLTKAENRLKEFREKNRQVLSPQLLLEQERLIRDVQINATIYIELAEALEIDDCQLTDETNLIDLPGFDSLTTLNLIAFIDQKFNIVVNINDLNKIKTVNDLISLIGKERFTS